MQPILEVRKLSMRVPTGHILQDMKQILDDISFSVRKGMATAYLGPNGAGKTSTFRILCGLCRPTAGEVLFDGCTLTGHGLPATRVGFMPEQPYFYRHLSVRELLDALGSLSGMSTGNRKASIEKWAQRLNFATVLDQRLHQCSKGQVQRVGLAQALMHEPEFLLLDEPMSGLDPIGRELVKDVLRDVVRQGTSLLFSSHILSDAESICEDVIIINRGRILYQGGIEALTLAEDAWDIEFAGPALAEVNALRITEHSWRITTASPEERDRLLRHLLNSPEHSIISVARHRQDLESAFVRLIRQGVPQ